MFVPQPAAGLPGAVCTRRARQWTRTPHSAGHPDPTVAGGRVAAGCDLRARGVDPEWTSATRLKLT
jgi:hypothetical protein